MALTLAMDRVRELGASITLIPSELGLSEEENFSPEDIPILISFLDENIGHSRYFDPDNQVILLGENDGVQLWIETNKAGDVVYFFTPEGSEP